MTTVLVLVHQEKNNTKDTIVETRNSETWLEQAGWPEFLK
jgi:hypothetical protein